MKLVIDQKIYPVEIYNHPFKRLLGFMFQKKIEKIICFPRCKSIHTFFMKCPITAIVLDKNFHILHIEYCMKKNRILIKKKAYYIIECNPDLIQRDPIITVKGTRE